MPGTANREYFSNPLKKKRQVGSEASNAGKEAIFMAAVAT